MPPGDNVPMSFREANGFFKMSRSIWFPTRAMRQDLRFTVLIREESLTICRCNYKGSTFSLVMLRLVKESKIIVVFIHFFLSIVLRAPQDLLVKWVSME